MSGSSLRIRTICAVNPSTPEFVALHDDEEVQFLPMEAVWTDRLDLSETRLKSAVSTGYTRFREGDLLLPKITPTFEAGRASIAKRLVHPIGAGTTELHVLRPSPDVEIRWLNYFLNSSEFLQRGRADMYGVAGQKRISDDFVKDYRILLPALTEQQRVAAFLDGETDRIDALIAEQQHLVGRLEQRLDAARALLLLGDDRSGMAIWRRGRLKRFVRVARGRFTHRPRNDPALYDGPYPFIQTGDIAGADDGVVRTYSQTLNEQGLQASRLAPEGTMVMAIAANIGDVARLGFDACFPDSVVALSPQPGLDADYLMQLVLALKSEFVGSSTLNTQLNINVERIGDVPVAIPPIEAQRALVAELHDLEHRTRSIAIEIEHQIGLLREHRQALITAAVTGGLEAVGRVA